MKIRRVTVEIEPRWSSWGDKLFVRVETSRGSYSQITMLPDDDRISFFNLIFDQAKRILLENMVEETDDKHE